MKFTQIDDESLRASNLSKTGAVYYRRWRDAEGEVYVGIADVVGGHGSGNGTFTTKLFRLSDIGDTSTLTGYDAITGSAITTKDRNMSGFLRAIKNDIIRRNNENDSTS